MLDVPSNDPDEPSLTVNMSGEGIEAPVTPSTPAPDGADSGFMLLDAASLFLLGLGGAYGWRRRMLAA
jgi:hypothetical protein